MFKDELIRKGIEETNAEVIANAIESLHKAFAGMDTEQMKKWQWEMPNLEDLLDDYAKIEELRVLNINTIR